jgi:hypothetical protein
LSACLQQTESHLKFFVNQFVLELFYDERSMKGISHVAHNHNTDIKIVSEFTEDMKKFCLEKKFSTKHLHIGHENIRWQHEK